MRYTARARMLSFDFLIDEVVYKLPPKQAHLLAGMIARADNLGRLPGEPAVLLSYLFYPRAPRPDLGSDDVEALLTTLATNNMITWYRFENARYVEFGQWTRHQSGLREHNRRSTLPAPGDAGADLVAVSRNSTELLRFDEPEPPSGPAVDVRALLKQVARDRDMDGALGNFQPDVVVQWCRSHQIGEESVTALKVQFSQWLWKTGVTNMDAIVAVLDEDWKQKPDRPYAYWAAQGKARNGVVGRFFADEQVKAHDDEKRATEKFLAGG